MIDDEITYREKGYRSTDLKPKSGKPVYAICDNPNCDVEGGRGRWVKKSDYRDLCFKCAMKNLPIERCEVPTEKLPWIDDDITYAEKGYRSTDLKSNSHKEVWCVCANPDCKREGGRGRWISFKWCRELCSKCAHKTEEFCRNNSKAHKGLQAGEKHYNWKGGISLDDYCKFFDEPLKDAVRNYFDNMCFECGETIEENKGRKMSVHHINYQKNCGCDNTQFCIYVPLCMKCHGKSNYNKWCWYTHFMKELALRNPNYYAYHIPVVYYDEPSYNYSYVFEKRRR